MKTSEFLRQHEWCQGNLAQDKDGNYIDFMSPDATNFCIMGSIYTTLGYASAEAQELIHKLLDKVQSIAHYNDNICKSKEEAIKLLEEAENDRSIHE